METEVRGSSLGTRNGHNLRKSNLVWGSLMLESSWIKTRRRQVKVEKVVGWCDVWTGDLPFAKFTLRVVENVTGGYQATPNVFVKSNEGIEYTGDRFYDEIEDNSS